MSLSMAQDTASASQGPDTTEVNATAPSTNAPTQSVLRITPNSSGSDIRNSASRTQKKARNYKSWTDGEIQAILDWFQVPENQANFAKNKAQTCRQAARELFGSVGEEYVAVTIRSKLMSLEKSFREGELLRTQLTEEGILSKSDIQARVKLMNRFHDKCSVIFGSGVEAHNDNTNAKSKGDHTNTVSTAASSFPSSPTTSHSQPSASTSATPGPRVDAPPQNPTTPANLPVVSQHPLPSASPSNGQTARQILPRVPEVQPVENTPLPQPVTQMARYPEGMWITEAPSSHTAHPRIHHPTDQPQASTYTVPYHHQDTTADIGEKRQSYDREEVLSKRRLREAKYAARQAEFEAIKAEHERQRMETALLHAQVEKERDQLAIQRLELEIELAKLEKKE